MRKPLIALALSAAAAASVAGSVVAGTGAAGATPIACPELPQDRIDGAIRSIAPPMPGVPWRVTGMGGSVDCTLNWVRLDTDRGTGSSPVQILLFDHKKFAGTPTPKGDAFTSVVGSNGPGQITIRFKWLGPNDANAAPSGSADVRFQTMPQSPPRPLDPIPAQVAD
ncbi:LppP/LprE family lipoprotein [Tsukamurella sp. USMM236]|uniref:LppP/LprE family lipoprotein n=1 Tax=Tsukamurella sp. USMM236 TaxID=3081301 RepID=UPI00301A4A62